MARCLQRRMLWLCVVSAENIKQYISQDFSTIENLIDGEDLEDDDVARDEDDITSEILQSAYI